MGASAPKPAVLRDPVPARWVGLGVVLLLAVAVLALALRGDDGTAQQDDDGGLFTPGPAYGGNLGSVYGVGGGNDVKDVLRADDDPGQDGDRRSTDSPGGAAGRGTDGNGDRFTHDVRERRGDEWLVEVTDGDRSARFEVGIRGSVPALEPVAAPAQRHGSKWVLAAERYLREREFAVETDPQ